MTYMHTIQNIPPFTNSIILLFSLQFRGKMVCKSTKKLGVPFNEGFVGAKGYLCKTRNSARRCIPNYLLILSGSLGVQKIIRGTINLGGRRRRRSSSSL